MEQLTRIKARIATLSELGEIIIAMRALAASALQEGRQAMPATSRYSRLIEDGIADVAAMLDLTAETIVETRQQPDTICIIGTEHGFVGDLNMTLLDGAPPLQDSRLVLVGQKLQVSAQERGLKPEAALSMTTHLAGVPRLARAISAAIGPTRHVQVVTPVQNAASNTISAQTRRVLPVSLPKASQGAAFPPLHQLPPGELLLSLAGEYLLAEISRTLIEALIGENQVRLGVLTAADRNIRNKREELHRKQQTLRQENITTELLDVVVGAEAITTGTRE